MKLTDLHKTLDSWDRRNRRVFTIGDLRTMFPEGSDDAFHVRLRKLAAEKDSVIGRAARGVYFYSLTRNPVANLIEEVARALRRGHHTYVSLESALSEHGLISQIPVGRLTLMTTGRSGEFETPWGVIEFTHTDRNPKDFVDDLQDVGRPLRIAGPGRAITDLRRVGRNTHLICLEADEEALDAPFC
ncbi:type IV toxin-antitoxin system AbiEi family antitoxin [Defluviimonas salinarum]|uniref:Transcriptional regulator, AbiEi antitoxin, Type IV TA system n=1 Tax=Defluviimonas salinarum TaxID=2992147 RepID=A0ABT3J871_9RHOB|nr:hypothetical protein [Defluviimonas salinarum]MCW3783579.1 hypothetical protein [Defluviimonas salinarum]